MTRPARILITGVTGFIGRHLFECLVATNHTIFTTSSSYFDGSEFHTKLDLRESTQIEKLLKLTKPTLIFHAAAISSIDIAEKEKLDAYNINVTATEAIAQWAAANGAKIVFYSSDFVFDGTNEKELSEDCLPNPLSYYGKTKRLAENAVESSGADYVIIRPVMVYGNVFEGQRLNFAVWIKNNVGKHLNITADQIRNPTHVSDVVEASIQLGFGSFSGVYHISGSETISVFDFAKQVLDYFNLDSSNLHAITTSELNAAGLRPLNSVLSNKKAKADFGYSPMSVREGIKLLK